MDDIGTQKMAILVTETQPGLVPVTNIVYFLGSYICHIIYLPYNPYMKQWKINYIGYKGQNVSYI